MNNKIQPTDEETAIYGIIPGPVWPDECGHEDGSYICSFELYVNRGKKPCVDKYDLYIFPQKHYLQEVCLRFGAQPQEYASPGSVGDFLSRGLNHRPYELAIRILLNFGRVTWQKKEAP